ncbi:Nif3-like dinuclear metal center hexameric protein [Gracilibacillus kekensis]|uniref:GTP cyclohydrolase 1 type 2 homolog n=1 Tax=Gracilibacillus kekensis TaxID=1027249 RepID=A0A1M7P498_9BACI|nr:Nif3-like dinuclear metal center hexameric protein [Gracilibacillus kekensis]SHN11464.1 dinuclear metal center protein, YbgI/SA1388 family [Gracilibacillus kekensis]
MTTVKQVVKLFEQWVPTDLAESWDNVGLQVGDKNQKVEKVMITLDVIDSVVEEAIENKVDFIIAHHPLLFKGLKEINFSDPKGRVIQKLIQHNISVYAAHTNLDVVKGGVNDLLAEKLEIENCKVLLPTVEDDLFKFIVYVPSTHIENVTNVIGEAGAGYIGEYSHCSFRSKGEGFFKPLEGTNPYIGEQGEIEQVEEYKLETIIKKYQISHVLQSAKKAHPYEEMAYDLVPLANKGDLQGIGRIGKLKQPVSLEKYCELVKEKLQIPSLRFVGDPQTIIQKVAILGGSGKGYIDVAKNAGADLYITGDLTFHEAQDAEQAGLCLIDPGHHVEEVMKDGVRNYLLENIDALPEKIEIEISNHSTDPFKYK